MIAPDSGHGPDVRVFNSHQHQRHILGLHLSRPRKAARSLHLRSRKLLDETPTHMPPLHSESDYEARERMLETHQVSKTPLRSRVHVQSGSKWVRQVMLLTETGSHQGPARLSDKIADIYDFFTDASGSESHQNLRPRAGTGATGTRILLRYPF